MYKFEAIILRKIYTLKYDKSHDVEQDVILVSCYSLVQGNYNITLFFITEVRRRFCKLYYQMIQLILSLPYHSKDCTVMPGMPVGTKLQVIATKFKAKP